MISWDLLKALKPVDNAPWLVIGDFSEILFHHEKSGGNLRSEKLMHNFRTALEHYGLKDLGHERKFFHLKQQT